jgi:hypothetical protein
VLILIEHELIVLIVPLFHLQPLLNPSTILELPSSNSISVSKSGSEKSVSARDAQSDSVASVSAPHVSGKRAQYLTLPLATVYLKSPHFNIAIPFSRSSTRKILADGESV